MKLICLVIFGVLVAFAFADPRDVHVRPPGIDGGLVARPAVLDHPFRHGPVRRPLPYLNRHKRFTCDLFTIGIKGYSGAQHAACAAKCVAQRHRYGRCEGTTCKCSSSTW